MNYFVFIDKYGKVTYKDKKETEIDILLFSQLAYLPMDNIDFKNNQKYTLEEIATNIDRSVFLESLIAQRNALKLLDAIKDLPRFKEIKVTDYSYIMDENSQFGAVTFILPNKQIVIAFQGTDNTIAGWKEDAILSYKYPTTSQELAGSYVEKIISKYKRSVIICGHSKGGNLALVGAMRTTLLKKLAIKEIYSFDGPGLRENEFNSNQYKQVRKKLHNIIPDESMVGVLFNQENLDVIKSNAKGIMQHATTSWQVEDDKLVRTNKSALSDNLDKAIYDWLSNYDLEQRKLIIDETFGLLEKSNIKRVSDISDNYLRSLFEVLKATETLDNQTKVVIFNCLKLLSTTLSKTLINMELNNLKKKINNNIFKEKINMDK